MNGREGHMLYYEVDANKTHCIRDGRRGREGHLGKGRRGRRVKSER
jgi:hypothetical protein